MYPGSSCRDSCTFPKCGKMQTFELILHAFSAWSCLCILLSLTPHLPLNLHQTPTAVKNRRVREDVGVHEVGRAHGLHQDHGRGRGAGPQVQREIRLPAGVHHERVHRATQAVRHNESGRKLGLQRLRSSYTQGFTVKVGGIV